MSLGGSAAHQLLYGVQANEILSEPLWTSEALLRARSVPSQSSVLSIFDFRFSIDIP